MYLIFQYLLELARKGGPEMTMRRKHFSPTYDSEERDRRTHRRYLKILREVKEECGDTTLSSDEEGNAWIELKTTGVNGERQTLMWEQCL